jgi:hypothetical protein
MTVTGHWQRTCGSYDYSDVPSKDFISGDQGKDGLQPTLRYIAKRCRHGLNYRMAAPRLAETTGLY